MFHQEVHCFEFRKKPPDLLGVQHSMNLMKRAFLRLIFYTSDLAMNMIICVLTLVRGDSGLVS